MAVAKSSASAIDARLRISKNALRSTMLVICRTARRSRPRFPRHIK
jgi:hypothetical protein